MKTIMRIADKAGALGTVVAAMGCAMCFPALASLGAAIGLSFLQQYESLKWPPFLGPSVKLKTFRSV